jgi:glyoxalase family protein
MKHPVLGLHHVTATVDDAQDDLDLCVTALGLRLVKKTVNFDNHHVYHFYYGDERGTPGTIWTTFPYKGHGVPVGKEGAGQISVTSFSVPAGSLEFWRGRLAAHGVATTDIEAPFGEARIGFSDASGLRFELVANSQDHRAPWTDEVDKDAAIHGLHSVTMVVRQNPGTLDLMKELLGFQVMDESENRIRVGVHGGGPGKSIDIITAPDAGQAKNGLGTVHHVAMAISDGEEQKRIRNELIHYGCTVTDIRDRCYFTSIYFREPGGVLFELATVGPGFLIDEPLSDLGNNLKLPPWEERFRSEIESGLAPVVIGSKQA